jgi:hypothetical protein
MKTFSTLLGTTFGMPTMSIKSLLMLAITGMLMAGTVTGVARTATAMGPMSGGCQADTSGPSLKELISTLKAKSAAPRSEDKAAAGPDAAEAKLPRATMAGPTQGSKRTVSTVASSKASGTSASAAKSRGMSAATAAGTSGATKKAGATAEPAGTKKPAAKQASATKASAKQASAKKASAKKASAKQASAKKASPDAAKSADGGKKVTGTAPANPGKKVTGAKASRKAA